MSFSQRTTPTGLDNHTEKLLREFLARCPVSGLWESACGLSRHCQKKLNQWLVSNRDMACAAVRALGGPHLPYNAASQAALCAWLDYPLLSLGPPEAADLIGWWFGGTAVSGTTVYDERTGLGATRVARAGYAGLCDGVNSAAVVVDAASIQNIWDGGGLAGAWVYSRSDGGGSTGRIFDKQGVGKGWVFYANNDAAGKAKLTFYHEFSTTDGQWDTTATVLTHNQPAWVGAAYDSSDVANNPTIYVWQGGVLNTYTVGSGLTESSTPVGTRGSDVGVSLFMCNNNSMVPAWDGLVLDMRLLNQAPVAADITAMLAHEATGKEGGWWCYCEESYAAPAAPKVHDISGNRNHATPSFITANQTNLWAWPGALLHWSRPNEAGYRFSDSMYIPAEIGTGLAADGNALTAAGECPLDMAASGAGLDGLTVWNNAAVTLTPPLAPSIINADRWGKLVRWGEGADVVTGGDFSNPLDWTIAGAAWTIAAGIASYDDTAVDYFTQALTVVAGRRYRFVFTISNTVGGDARLALTNQTGTGLVTYASYANGTHTIDFVSPLDATAIRIYASNVGGAFDLDDVALYPLQTLANTLVLPAQLLADGDMEAAGVGSWTAVNATLSKQVDEGVRCLRVLNNTGGVANVWARQTILTVGSIFRVSGEARGDGGAGKPELWDTVGKKWDGTTSTTWQSFTVEFAALATQIYFGDPGSANGSYTEWRNIRVELVMSDTERAIRENYFNQQFADMSLWDRTAAAQSGSVSQLLTYDAAQVDPTLTSIKDYVNCTEDDWIAPLLVTTSTSGFDPTITDTSDLLPIWWLDGGEWITGIAPTIRDYTYVGLKDVVIGPPALYEDITALDARGDNIDEAHLGDLTSCATISLQDNAMTQAEVDAVINELYENRDALTTITINIAGTNAAPSATGLAQIAVLTAAPYNWTITHS